MRIKHVCCLLMLIVLSGNIFADFNQPSMSLKGKEMDDAVKLAEKNFPLFTVVSARKTKIDNTHQYIELIGDITKANFCRLNIIKFESDKKIKKVIDIVRRQKYFSYKESTDCPKEPKDYIYSGSVDIPDFLIEIIRDDIDGILLKIGKETGKDMSSTQLKELRFTQYRKKGEVIMNMEFSSEKSLVSHTVIVDIKDGNLMLLDSSFGERI